MANDQSLAAEHTDHRGRGHHIVHANHVAGGTAHRLQGDDPGGIHADTLPNAELERREHHVAYGVAAGNKCAEPADESCKQRPCASREHCNAICQFDWHTIESGSATIGVNKHLRHRYCEYQRDGCLHCSFTRPVKCTRERWPVHAMKQIREQNGNEKDCSRQIQWGYVDRDVRIEYFGYANSRVLHE